MGIHPYSVVLDPDLEITGGGVGVWGWGKAGLQKKIILALRASVWSKNKEGQAPFLAPPLFWYIKIILHVVHKVNSACKRSRPVLPYPATGLSLSKEAHEEHLTTEAVET